MKARYILAPEAALDLVEIWRHIKEKSGREIADKAESVIREKLVFLAANPGGGHWREDLTADPVKFFPVYSYLIVYQPGTKPLQVVAILHGNRDVARLLKDRFVKSELNYFDVALCASCSASVFRYRDMPLSAASAPC